MKWGNRIEMKWSGVGIGAVGFLVGLRSVDSVFLIQAVVTCAVLAASLFVILCKDYAPKDKHWAYATVGTLLGFWLHYVPK